jgi:hypothetical protein
MTIPIYEVVIAGAIGMVLQMLLKARSLQQKARLANVQFKFMEYFTGDIISHIISILAIALYVMLVRGRLNNVPANLHEVILAFSATVGYSGADIVSRFFSFTNNKINAAIDFKSTKSDIADGVDPKVPTPK